MKKEKFTRVNATVVGLKTMEVTSEYSDKTLELGMVKLKNIYDPAGNTYPDLSIIETDQTKDQDIQPGDLVSFKGIYRKKNTNPQLGTQPIFALVNDFHKVN